MSDDQIIALLTEIRDLEKRNAENYERALAKQQEAIDLQKKNVAEFRDKYVARQRMVILTVVAIGALIPVLFGKETVGQLETVTETAPALA